MTARRQERLSFAPPYIGEEEIAEVVDALRSGWITTGPKTAEFGRRFADYVGAPDALPVSSCTAALHLGVLGLGVRPGDAVVTTTMTFCSTVHVIEHAGATPILADVDPVTLNLTAGTAAAAVKQARAAGLRPRLLLPVHFAGHPCDMGELLALAAEEGLAVLEDAAHALPARWDDHTVGSVDGPVPRAVAFSFYATKNLTTGEGGMLTAAPEVLDEARVWSLHGMNRDAWKRYGDEGSWYYEVTRAGFKYNLTDIASAIGLAQLRRLDGFHARRRSLVAHYVEGLAGVDGIELPVERPGYESAWHLFVVRLDLDRLTLGRDRFIAELEARNIAASVHFIPVHLHPYYRERHGFAPDDFPVARAAYERIVSLPLHLGMTEADVDDVVAAVADITATFGR